MRIHYFVPLFLIALALMYFPLREYTELDIKQIQTLLIFIALFFILATEYRHRTVASLTSLTVLWSLGILSGGDIAHYVEFDVLGLLFGMMVIVETLREAGFISLLTQALVSLRMRSFYQLLIAFSLLTFILSAFLDNATVMLIVVPIALGLCEILRLNPIPMLLTLNVSSNLGGIITPIGDPPNIMIASHLGISFSEFMLNAAPPTLLSYIISMLALFSIYRQDLLRRIEYTILRSDFKIEDKRLFLAGAPTLALVIFLFLTEGITGLKPATAALYGAVFLLILGGDRMNLILRKVNWDLLIFMGSIIAFSRALGKVGILHLLAQSLTSITQGNELLLMILMNWISSLAAAFVDNIPYTAVMISVLDELVGSTGLGVLWWIFVVSVGIGGMGTPVASVPSLVTYSALRERSGFKFSDFMKIGFTILMILASLVSLYYVSLYLLSQ